MLGSRTEGWWWSTGVDEMALSQGTIVAIGDSIWGQYLSRDRSFWGLEQLQRRLTQVYIMKSKSTRWPNSTR